MILEKHYAKRMPQIKYAFVCGDSDRILGCCTFSQPASYTLCEGVCGKQHKSIVLELSRLYLEHNKKNLASQLVGFALKNLPMRPAVLVSYADPQAGHVGFIYQATNWIYTGQGNAEPSWARPDTGEIISNTRRHIDQKAERLGFHWQELIKIPRQGKHRYVTFVGTKRQRKILLNNLRYPKKEYPKNGNPVADKTRGDRGSECFVSGDR